MNADDVLPGVLAANTARRAHQPDVALEARLHGTFACAHRLAAYGSLAPGGTHHHLLARCGGTWTAGTIHGRVAQREYRVFTFDPAATAVAVHVLHSEALATQWPALDDFEGADYRRILVPVFTGPRLVTVANLYEAVAPVP